MSTHKRLICNDPKLKQIKINSYLHKANKATRITAHLTVSLHLPPFQTLSRYDIQSKFLPTLPPLFPLCGTAHIRQRNVSCPLHIFQPQSAHLSSVQLGSAPSLHFTLHFACVHCHLFKNPLTLSPT